MTRLVTMGESLGAVRSTQPGGFALGEGAALGVGGAESNVAIAASRLGIAATWVGRVGDDVVGSRIVRDLRAEGVDVRVVVDRTAPTGLLLKNQARPGRVDVAYYRAGSAASKLSPADVERAEITSADLLHVTGITPALSATASAAVFSAVETARDRGAVVSFDINHRSRLWSADAARSTYQRLVASADIVFASDDEAALTLGGDGTPRELADGLRALGAHTVVIKLGDRGAGSLVDGEWRERAAARVAVVDTVGAGDAFVGAYLAATLLELDLDERLRLAVENGAAACTHPGDWEGSARLDELTSPSGDPVRR